MRFQQYLVQMPFPGLVVFVDPDSSRPSYCTYSSLLIVWGGWVNPLRQIASDRPPPEGLRHGAFDRTLRLRQLATL